MEPAVEWEEKGRPLKGFWLTAEGQFGQTLRRGVRRALSWDPFYGDARHYDFAHRRTRASRIALVNHLIAVNGYRDYLEIGVRQRGDMFEQVHAERRISVDPDVSAGADYPLPSDTYFATHDHRFDIVFIDGNHTGDQVERDIVNALDRLNPGGVVLLHDMNPPTRFHGREEYEVSGRYPPWNGTSWKGYAKLRATRPDLSMCVVKTDWGVGVVHPGSQRAYEGSCDDYDDLARDRQGILNLITVRAFLDRYGTPIRQAAP